MPLRASTGIAIFFSALLGSTASADCSLVMFQDRYDLCIAVPSILHRKSPQISCRETPLLNTTNFRVDYRFAFVKRNHNKKFLRASYREAEY